jgi:hypothetical protein
MYELDKKRKKEHVHKENRFQKKQMGNNRWKNIKKRKASTNFFDTLPKKTRL